MCVYVCVCVHDNYLSKRRVHKGFMVTFLLYYERVLSVSSKKNVDTFFLGHTDMHTHIHICILT